MLAIRFVSPLCIALSALHHEPLSHQLKLFCLQDERKHALCLVARGNSFNKVAKLHSLDVSEIPKQRQSQALELAMAINFHSNRRAENHSWINVVAYQTRKAVYQLSHVISYP
jgi:hypothetical protein